MPLDCIWCGGFAGEGGEGAIYCSDGCRERAVAWARGLSRRDVRTLIPMWRHRWYLIVTNRSPWITRTAEGIVWGVAVADG
jgi:hypothetical protein